MFRLTYDPLFENYFIHKNFLIFWIKYGIEESNRILSINKIKKFINEGKYIFILGENVNYWIIRNENPQILYCKNYEDFLNSYPEKFI